MSSLVPVCPAMRSCRIDPAGSTEVSGPPASSAAEGGYEGADAASLELLGHRRLAADQPDAQVPHAWEVAEDAVHAAGVVCEGRARSSSGGHLRSECAGDGIVVRRRLGCGGAAG